MPSIETLNIKVKGKFNKHIFTPAWIIDNLSVGMRKLTPEDIEISFELLEKEVAYTFNSIRLLPYSDLVSFFILKKDDRHIKYAMSLFIKLFKTVSRHVRH